MKIRCINVLLLFSSSIYILHTSNIPTPSFFLSFSPTPSRSMSLYMSIYHRIYHEQVSALESFAKLFCSIVINPIEGPVHRPRQYEAACGKPSLHFVLCCTQRPHATSHVSFFLFYFFISFPANIGWTLMI